MFAGITPAQVRGVYSADDMMQQIGIFTKYLAAHASEYGANLDSVFISGGSAGGQLTGAVALGITSKKYPDWFAGKEVHVRGMIPFYPRVQTFESWIVSREAPQSMILRR